MKYFTKLGRERLIIIYVHWWSIGFSKKTHVSEQTDQPPSQSKQLTETREVNELLQAGELLSSVLFQRWIHPRLKFFLPIFYTCIYVYYLKLKKKRLLYARVCQLPGASPPGPPPGLCPGPTWCFKAAPRPPAFYCAPITFRNFWIRHCFQTALVVQLIGRLAPEVGGRGSKSCPRKT
jgi:hypothetical protein